MIARAAAAVLLILLLPEPPYLARALRRAGAQRRHRLQRQRGERDPPLLPVARAAVRKAEDKQPGGHLARATYSAYNGGPGQLDRYRNAKTPPVWKKVDEVFWTKFRTVSAGAGQELAVRTCYAS